MSTDTAIQLYQSNLPVGSLDAYIQRVNQVPMLTAEQEYDLAKRLQETGDLKAAQDLVLAHLRYVVKVARGYMGYGLMISDLIQEGTVGLMKAVKKFDPDKGVRLVSFAVHWIKSEIHEFVIKNWKIVKVATTKAQRKLFFNLRSKKESLGWFTKEEVESVAKDLGVKPEEVIQMEQRLHSHDMSFDLPAIDSDDSNALPAPSEIIESQTIVDPLKEIESSNWENFANKKLQIALENLDEKSRDIIKKRWFVEDSEKSTLKELAKKYNISTERVRQLEANAIKKLKAFILDS